MAFKRSAVRSRLTPPFNILYLFKSFFIYSILLPIFHTWRGFFIAVFSQLILKKYYEFSKNFTTN